MQDPADPAPSTPRKRRSEIGAPRIGGSAPPLGWPAPALAGTPPGPVRIVFANSPHFAVGPYLAQSRWCPPRPAPRSNSPTPGQPTSAAVPSRPSDRALANRLGHAATPGLRRRRLGLSLRWAPTLHSASNRKRRHHSGSQAPGDPERPAHGALSERRPRSSRAPPSGLVNAPQMDGLLSPHLDPPPERPRTPARLWNRSHYRA